MTIANLALDAGHGGTDPGCTGGGLAEKNLTLAITLALGAKLSKRGFGVTYTRTSDVFVSLSGRCSIANNAQHVDIFVSTHVNAGGGRGAEVYALPGGKAEILASKVGNKLSSYMGTHGTLVKTDKNFTVLVGTNMPAILSEIGFIDSSDIDKIRGKEDYFAQLIYEGICDFYGVSYGTVTPETWIIKINDVQKGSFTTVESVVAEFNRLRDQAEPGTHMIIQRLPDGVITTDCTKPFPAVVSTTPSTPEPVVEPIKPAVVEPVVNPPVVNPVEPQPTNEQIESGIGRALISLIKQVLIYLKIIKE